MRGMARRIIFCILALGICLIAGPADRQGQAAPLPQEVSIAVSSDSAPFYFLNREGQADGWLVDIWKAWGEVSGIEVRFISVPFGQTLELVKKGEADIQGGAFYSEERDRFLDYCGDLAETWTTFFFHQDIYGIRELEDLRPYRIGVIEGDLALEYLREKLPGASLVIYESNEALFAGVARGEVRVFIKDVPIALAKLRDMHILHSYRYLPYQKLYSKFFQATVRQGDKAMAKLVEQGLARIDAKRLMSIRAQWAGQAQPDEDTGLRIACNRYFPPFTMLTTSGQASGMFVDLWRLWGRKVKRKVSFVFGDWDDTLEYLGDGRADIHSGLFKSQELENFLAFSTPIFTVRNNLAFQSGDKPVTLEDLQGSKVGVIAGLSTGGELAREYPGLTQVLFPGYRQLLAALSLGDVRAVYDIGLTLREAIAEMGLRENLKVSTYPNFPRTIYAAVQKGQAELLDTVNRGFASISRQEMAEIEEQWVHYADLRNYGPESGPLVLSREEMDYLNSHSPLAFSEVQWEPLSITTDPGRFDGMIADYLRIITGRSGLKFAYQPSGTWKEVLDKYARELIEVVPALSMGDDPGREILLSEPFVTFPLVIVTRDDVSYLADASDLHGRKVAVGRGYTSAQYLRKNHPQVELLEVDDVEKGLLEVSKGRAFAFVGHMAVAVNAMQKMGSKDLKIAGETGYRFEHRIGVDPRHPEAVSIINKVLAGLSETDRRALYNKWMSVEYARGIDYGLVWKVAGGGLLFLLLVMFWNRRLAREIMGRKKAEERFQTMAANIPGAIFQARITGEGNLDFRYVSPGIRDYFGIGSAELEKGSRELDIHPDEREHFRRVLARAAAKKTDLEFVGKLQDGDGRAKWMRISAKPSTGIGGETIYNGLLLDITQRKLAELEYLTTERKINAMSQAVDDALVMIDSKGRVLFWNQAAERLFGYGSHEAMGLDFHQMAVKPEDRDKAAQGMEEFARSGRGPVLGHVVESVARDRAGREFPVEVSVSSFQVDDQWYAVGVVRDITERKAAGEALRESEQRFRTLVGNLPGVVYRSLPDPERTILYINEMAGELTGYPGEGFIQNRDRSFNQMIHPDDAARVREVIGRALADTSSFSLEYRIIRASGKTIWVHEHGSPSLEEDTGRPAWLDGVIFDITERKKAEEAVKESQRRLSDIIEFLPDATLVVDKDGRVLAWNRAMVQLTGVAQEDMVGKDNYEYALPFYGERRPILLDLAISWDDDLARRYISIQKEGETFISESFHPGLAPGGVYLSGIARVLYDSEGRMAGAIEALRDVTRRKRAEEALAESEVKSRLLLESVGEGIFGVDARGLFTFVNPAAQKILGYQEDELTGLPMHQTILHALLGGGENPEEDDAVRFSLTQGGTRHVAEGTFWRKDGGFFYSEYSSTPIQKDGKVVGAVVVFRDITERKKVEEELNSYIRDLERFNRLVVGREEKMIRLKEEINDLLAGSGKGPRYKIVA